MEVHKNASRRYSMTVFFPYSVLLTWILLSAVFSRHFWYSPSHCTISIAVSRLVRETHASSALKALKEWYNTWGADFPDLRILRSRRITKGQYLAPFFTFFQVSLWGCFSIDPLHLLEFPFSDPKVRNRPLLLSDNSVSTQVTLSERSAGCVTRKKYAHVTIPLWYNG
jgi:hypothetical protein